MQDQAVCQGFQHLPIMLLIASTARKRETEVDGTGLGTWSEKASGALVFLRRGRSAGGRALSSLWGVAEHYNIMGYVCSPWGFFECWKHSRLFCRQTDLSWRTGFKRILHTETSSQGNFTSANDAASCVASWRASHIDALGSRGSVMLFHEILVQGRHLEIAQNKYWSYVNTCPRFFSFPLNLFEWSVGANIQVWKFCFQRPGVRKVWFIAYYRELKCWFIAQICIAKLEWRKLLRVMVSLVSRKS